MKSTLLTRTSTSRLVVTGAITAIMLSSCALAWQVPAAMGAPRASIWNVAIAPTPTGNWFAVDYADGQWVALGDQSEVAVSSSGAAWTESPAPAGSWHSVAYGDGHFVALSSVNAGLEEMVSTNGVNWTAMTGPSGPWTGLTFGGGQFVAVSSNGLIANSTDGVKWTQVWNHINYDLTSVTYGGGHFVAADAALGALVISATGSTWSRYLLPMTGLKWGAVVYGNGNFVALSTGTGYVATSVFGYVWTLHQYSPAQTTNAATFGCGEFVAVGESSNATDNFLLSSTGEEWSSAATPMSTAPTWTAVAYGDHRFVAVNSTGNIAWSNSELDCAAVVPTAPLQVSGNIHDGEVWTFMHPSSDPGGAPVTDYRVTISNGSVTKDCPAAVYSQPNCIIKGLNDREVYWVTAQARNRFGYSVATDPIFVVPESSWSFSATTAATVIAQSVPVVVQVSGVVANGEGVYPTSLITVHFGSRVTTCHANPFGECLITIPNPPVGSTSIFATYTGYGRSYRSPRSYVTIVSS